MNSVSSVQDRLWLRLTRACNQRCVFCHDREAQNGSMAPLGDVKGQLEAGRAKGISRVVLSGGEPTIHPEFHRAVSLAGETGYSHIQTVTNGRRFCHPEFLGKAVEAGLDEATFSLHGHTPELHDSQTRTAGSFVQALAGLRAALAVRGLIVSVDVVVSKRNIRRLREILEFFIGLGVREFDLLHLVPFGDAWENREDLFYDPAQESASLRSALELSRLPGIVLWTNRLPARYLEGFESLIQPPKKLLDEVRGRAPMMSDFLNRGMAPSCRGERCRFCFLEEFCNDLSEFRANGSLSARTIPPCLSELASGNGADGMLDGSGALDGATGASEGTLKLEGEAGMDIFRFAEFFLNRRCFLKGQACRGCPGEAGCEGAPAEFVRRGLPRLLPRAQSCSPSRRVLSGD